MKLSTFVCTLLFLFGKAYANKPINEISHIDQKIAVVKQNIHDDALQQNLIENLLKETESKIDMLAGQLHVINTNLMLQVQKISNIKRDKAMLTQLFLSNKQLMLQSVRQLYQKTYSLKPSLLLKQHEYEANGLNKYYYNFN